VHFLQVDFSLTVPRAQRRDRNTAADEVARIYATRYVPGQRLYLAAQQPTALASVVIDNADFDNPKIIEAV